MQKCLYDYGCIFCMTGAEHAVAQNLNRLHPTMVSIVAEKLTRKRVQGGVVENKAILFPGYVFFRVPREDSIPAIFEDRNIIKVLTTGEKNWKLTGNDLAFAEWLYKNDGLFGFSKSYFLGDRIKIISGPLVGYEGAITKVNKRYQNCQVVVKFADHEFKIWLGLELISNI